MSCMGFTKRIENAHGLPGLHTSRQVLQAFLQRSRGGQDAGFADTHLLQGLQTPILLPGFADTHLTSGFADTHLLPRGVCRHPLYFPGVCEHPSALPGFADTHLLPGLQSKGFADTHLTNPGLQTPIYSGCGVCRHPSTSGFAVECGCVQIRFSSERPERPNVAPRAGSVFRVR